MHINIFKHSGFSLIELLISMLLIALLIMAINQFFIGFSKNSYAEINRQNIDNRAELALQILGSDISQAAHILDAGSVPNSSAQNLQAWLNLSAWVQGADLQIWHLMPQTDFLVLNSPKPIASNVEQLAVTNNFKNLQIVLDGAKTNKINLLCANFMAENKNLFNTDFANLIRITNTSVNPTQDTFTQGQELEDFLLKNFALTFGTWQDKFGQRQYPNTWRETQHLILDTSQTILPSKQGCIKLQNPPWRLMTSQTDKIENISDKISKNALGVYIYSQAGKSQKVTKNFYSEHQPIKISYFNSKDELLSTKNQRWRRLNAKADFLPKDSNLDKVQYKTQIEVLGQIKNSTQSKIYQVVKHAKYLPLLRASNADATNKYFYFYANSNLAKSYVKQIEDDCPSAKWQKPQIVDFEHCQNLPTTADFYEKNCRANSLPTNTPLFDAKIQSLKFSCAVGFEPILASNGQATYINAKPIFSYFKIPALAEYASEAKTPSLIYSRLNTENSNLLTSFKRIEDAQGNINYLENSTHLANCNIKRFRKKTANSAEKIAVVPSFKFNEIYPPSEYLPGQNSASFKQAYNCVNSKQVQIQKTPWRFNIQPLQNSLVMNLKFEPHLWYVQKPPPLQREDKNSLIYSVAKCTANKYCQFDNKNIRNQINGLNNMQIRFLHPLTGKWLNSENMQIWLTNKNLKWDKIKAVKIGLLVCDTQQTLPNNQSKTYRVLDVDIRDTSAYCAVVKSSFYLQNPGLNMR